MPIDTGKLTRRKHASREPKCKSKWASGRGPRGWGGHAGLQYETRSQTHRAERDREAEAGGYIHTIEQHAIVSPRFTGGRAVLCRLSPIVPRLCALCAPAVIHMSHVLARVLSGCTAHFAPFVLRVHPLQPRRLLRGDLR